MTDSEDRCVEDSRKLRTSLERKRNAGTSWVMKSRKLRKKEIFWVTYGKHAINIIQSIVLELVAQDVLRSK